MFIKVTTVYSVLSQYLLGLVIVNGPQVSICISISNTVFCEFLYTNTIEKCKAVYSNTFQKYAYLLILL